MPHTPSKPKLIAFSIVSGLVLTIVLTILALQAESRAWTCTFAWQACLLQQIIHTPDNPIHEASPIDFFAFMFGVALGMPIYSFLTYFVLLGWTRSTLPKT